VSEATHRARDPASGAVLADRLRSARTHWARLWGLLGTRRLAPGDGLWLMPCRQVHTVGMRYPIDVAFLDEGYRVVCTIDGLRPGRLSPWVACASSVLELPAGTLARTRLAAGTRVEIEGAAENGRGRRIGAMGAAACNLGLASLYVLFAAAHLAVARRTGEWATTMPIVGQEFLLVMLFLARRPSLSTSFRPSDWTLGIVGTFAPLLMRASGRAGALGGLGAPFVLCGLLLTVTGLLFLGRSIGVVAADRGIKMEGIYRVVRHPMYAGYSLSYLGYVLSYPSARNCLITAVTLVALNGRAVVEERFLARSPFYRDYLRRVPWRLVPYVY